MKRAACCADGCLVAEARGSQFVCDGECAYKEGVMDGNALMERVAQLIAHRACHNQEQDVLNGKLGGYCIVCGVPWPCAYAGQPPIKE